MRKILLAFLPLASLAATAQTATVHYYRYKQIQGATLNPSVYCDGVKVARIRNGTFVDVQVPVGTHVFYANDKQAGASVDLEAGKDYYFRLDLQVGFLKGHYRLMMVMPEQGKFDEAKLKPLPKNADNADNADD